MSKSMVKKIQPETVYTPNNSRELFGLITLKNNHKSIRGLRKALGDPSHHGNKVWKACIVLMDYLTEYPIEKKSHVMDVGCGWGLGGLFCAKKFEAKVTSVDIDKSVFPYLELHADINGVKGRPLQSSFQKVSANQLRDVDVLIGADICFWDEMAKPLLNVVKRAYKSETRVIITDPGRPPFFEMAEICQKKLGADLNYWSVAEPYNKGGYVLDIAPKV